MSPSSESAPALRVTLLTGFLGAGKTTLLKRLLDAVDRRRVVVLENELGDASVEDELVRSSSPGRLETVSGRTCCEARTEFAELLHSVARVAADFDRLFIETTGVAHPGMIAHALLADPVLRRYFQIDGIVAVVDAAHFQEHAGRDGHATEQVAYADVVVINKIDLVPPEDVESLLETLQGINSTARYFVTAEAKAPADELLNLGGFDLAKVENGVDGCHRAAHGQTPREPAGPHPHEIETVSVELPGALGAAAFQSWINRFVATHATDLFRAKGIIALHNVPERLVFQGIHGRFRCTLGRPWDQDEPASRVVFIGRNLDRDEISRGMESCRTEART